MDVRKGFWKHCDNGLVTFHCPLSGEMLIFPPVHAVLGHVRSAEFQRWPLKFLTLSYSMNTNPGTAVKGSADIIKAPSQLVFKCRYDPGGPFKR